MENFKELQKDQNLFSIRKEGEVLGYIESKDGCIVTSGMIGYNTYTTLFDFIIGIQGHDISIDDFYT
jgi:hypothetical protein